MNNKMNWLIIKVLFLEEVIRPFRVVLSPGSRLFTNVLEKQDGKILELHPTLRKNGLITRQGGNSKLRHCLLCDKSFAAQFNLATHMGNEHAGQFFECKRKHNNLSSRFFLTAAEKTEHVLRNHKSMRKCEFCHINFNPQFTGLHIKTFHKRDNLVRCSYKLCVTYFRSQAEKQKHEGLVHHKKKEKCLFCGSFVESLNLHIRHMHKSQLPSAFKCTFRCAAYFLTETERDEHVASAHGPKGALVRQEVKCIYCKKSCTDKQVLYSHIKKIHKYIK